MTATFRVSDFKGSSSSNKQKVPKEGSKIRMVYDLARSGEWFNQYDTSLKLKPKHGEWANLIESLQTYYGQEFERRQMIPEHKARIAGRRMYEYRLKGEWEGNYFLTLEQILQQDNRHGIN